MCSRVCLGYLVIEQSFEQKNGVSSFTNIHSIFFKT